MVSVAKIKASDGRAYAEYLDGKTQAKGAEKDEQRLTDYYAGAATTESVTAAGEAVEAPGRWASGAELIGVSPAATDDRGQRIYPTVTGEQLRSLLAVERPDTGEPLRAAGPGGAAVAGIDLTFSPPKSVSAVWAVSNPATQAQIEAAHERAVDRALAYARDHVPVARVHRRGETPERVLARDLIATSWRHTTARASADGRLPDPQLHSHVIVHAAERSDGRIVAVDSYALMSRQRTIGASYDAAMAAEMRELGYGIETATGKDGRYFEIAGVPKDLLREWSSRAQAVEAELRNRIGDREGELEDAIATARASGQIDQAEHDEQRLDRLRSTQRLVGADHRAAAVSTRLSKGEISRGDLYAEWSATAREHGMSGLEAADLRRPGIVEEPTEAALDATLIARLTEHDAAVEPHVAHAIAMEGGARNPDTALGALERLRASGEIVDIRVPARKEGAGPVHMVTTQAQIQREHRTLAALDALAEARTQACNPGTVDRAIAAGEHELSAEQRQMVEHATGESRLTVVIGPAGSGKSLALQAIARAHASEGRAPLVIAPTGVTAQRLAGELTEAGAPTDALTGAKLCREWERGEIAAGPTETWIIDEAAAVNTRELEAVLSLARDGGTQVVMVADPRQHGSVAAGGLWPAIEERARESGDLIELTELRRARDPADRQAQWLWRSGEQAEALGNLDHRERVHILPADPEPAERGAEDVRLTRAERDAIAMAQTQRESGGDVLIVAETTNAKIHTLNAYAQARAMEARDMDGRPASIATAPERPYQLRAGDPIQVRRNIETESLGSLRNGTLGQILDVGPSPDGEWAAHVHLTDGREGWIGERELAEADTRLAYVVHPMVAQGATVEHSHTLVGPQSSAEGSYVGITRARGEAHIWADDPLLDLQAARDAAETESDAHAPAGRSDGERLNLLANAMSRSAESPGILAMSEPDTERVPDESADADTEPTDWRERERQRIQADQERLDSERERERDEPARAPVHITEAEADQDADWREREQQRIQADQERLDREIERERESEPEWEI